MTQEQIKKNILFEDYEILQQLLKAPSVSVAKQRFLRGDKEAVNAMLKIQEHKIMASDPDSGIICNWESLEKALEKKADVGHTHQPADIDNLEASLNNKADALHIHTWDEVTGKPATFLPTPHEHSISEVSGLTQELANKAYTSGNYPNLTVGSTAKWGDQVYTGNGAANADLVMVYINDTTEWTWMSKANFQSWIGLGQLSDYAKTDGSNTVGGNWNINYIGSPRLASGGAEAQVFYASGNKEIFWGNPRLQYHRFQGTDENSMLYYATNKQAYGFVWNEFNMPHYRKYGLGVDYRITTPNIDTLTETQFNTILPSTQGTLPFHHGTLLHQTYDANGSEWTQTGIDVGSGNLYFRVKNIGEGIGAWKSVWHTENFNPDSKADTSGSYPALNVGNAEQWSGQKYISSGTSSADLVMVYKEAENAWTWIPKTDFQNWLGLAGLASQQWVQQQGYTKTQIGVNNANYSSGPVDFIGTGGTTVSKAGNKITINSSGGSSSPTVLEALDDTMYVVPNGTNGYYLRANYPSFRNHIIIEGNQEINLQEAYDNQITIRNIVSGLSVSSGRQHGSKLSISAINNGTGNYFHINMKMRWLDGSDVDSFSVSMGKSYEFRYDKEIDRWLITSFSYT